MLVILLIRLDTSNQQILHFFISSFHLTFVIWMLGPLYQVCVMISSTRYQVWDLLFTSFTYAVLSSHDISAVECASYSAAAGDLGTAVDAALCGENAKVRNVCVIAKLSQYHLTVNYTLISNTL